MLNVWCETSSVKISVNTEFLELETLKISLNRCYTVWKQFATATCCFFYKYDDQNFLASFKKIKCLWLLQKLLYAKSFF